MDFKAYYTSKARTSSERTASAKVKVVNGKVSITNKQYYFNSDKYRLEREIREAVEAKNYDVFENVVVLNTEATKVVIDKVYEIIKDDVERYYQNTVDYAHSEFTKIEERLAKAKAVLDLYPTYKDVVELSKDKRSDEYREYSNSKEFYRKFSTAVREKYVDDKLKSAKRSIEILSERITQNIQSNKMDLTNISVFDSYLKAMEIIITDKVTDLHCRFVFVDSVIITPHYRYIITARKSEK